MPASTQAYGIIYYFGRGIGGNYSDTANIRLHGGISSLPNYFLFWLPVAATQQLAPDGAMPGVALQALGMEQLTPEQHF